VSTGQLLLLGFLAGATIFLGLPVGRLRSPRPRLKTFLNAFSAGILLFLLFDILENAIAPIEHAVELLKAGTGSAAALAGVLGVFALGFGVGLLSLAYMDKWQRSRRPSASIGPGAMAVAEASSGDAARQSALRLGLSIAAGIGLHNFSEGLAIGQAAHTGAVQLALLLVIGFALHNATEGFGIVGPLAAEDVRPTWGYLLLAGLIGGGPTFLGTILGQAVTSAYVFVAFLAMAAGAIIYVIAELLNIGRKLGDWDLTMWGVLAGFLLGLCTELVLVAAGA
jgi:zinc transporter, ZIP family